MFLIPELAIERWLFHDGLSVNDGRLVALAPAVEEATVFGIDCSRSWRQADSMLIGRWTARSMRPPKRFVHSRPISMSRQRRCASRSKRRRLVGRLARRCLRRCDADLSEGRCESRSTVWVGRPQGGLCRRARATCARRGTPSMLVPQAAASANPRTFLRRMVGAMFMRVNSKCAHQVRPPSGRSWLSATVSSFDRLMEHVIDHWRAK